MTEYDTGAYGIFNTVNGKVYVGGAYLAFRKRERNHFSDLRKGTHFNSYLQSAWNKHGENCFEFRILERCQSNEVQAVEQRWMDELKAADRRFGYNLYPTAGSPLGCKHSEEARTRIAEAVRRRMRDPEARKRASEVARKVAQTAEHKLRAKENLHNPVAHAKRARAVVGQKRSAETRARMVEAHRKRK